jgi:heterodisulfide reductase subunit A-like polyferredoxin
MNRPVLIVGGGPSGLSAAHALAAAGQRVVLVDKADRLGGAPILSGYAKLVPSGEWAKDAIGGMVNRIESNKLVDVRKNATVKTFVGGHGDFHATLSDGKQVEAGAAILCTGFTHFDSVNKPEWGFGTYPDVVTTTQVEQMFSSGKGVRCPSDGREPQRVAILLCVRFARSPDRPRMVLENLLHGFFEPGDGDPGGAAELQRLHLLHGYPHLRPLRGPLLLGEPRRSIRSNTSRRVSRR